MKCSWCHRLFGLILVMFLAGCTTGPRWPAVSDPATGEHVPGRWIWVDLLTPDVAASEAFYRAVFGWQTRATSDAAGGYALMAANNSPVAGIARYPVDANERRQARWLGLMSSDDVAAAVARGGGAGGATRLAAQRLPGRGEVAVLADPEGAVFALIHSETGDPPPGFPAVGALLWMELWAADGESQARYYREVGGYTVSAAQSSGDVDEWHLSRDGQPRAGIVQVREAGEIAAWLPYFRVASLDATLQRAVSAGGRVLVDPDPAIRGGHIAVVVDPLGAAFGIAEWDPEEHGPEAATGVTR